MIIKERDKTFVEKAIDFIILGLSLLIIINLLNR